MSHGGIIYIVSVSQLQQEKEPEDIIQLRNLPYRVPNVFSPLTPMPDNKFFDLYYNTWYLYSNEPLKKSIERFAKFPIATSFENNEPRLLLVSVDVQEGSQVVFDSYVKEDGSRKSEYGEYGPDFARGDNKHEGYEYLIRYDNGIPVDFVLAILSNISSLTYIC